MSYSALSDVANVIPLWPITSSSIPNTAQASALMTQCASEINAALSSRGIAVPVTAPATFLSDLLVLNAQGTAAMVLLAMFPSTDGSGSVGLGPMLWKAYQSRLAEIRKGIGIPVDVVLAEDTQAPRGYLTDEGALDNTGTVDAFGRIIRSEPFFSMETIF